MPTQTQLNATEDAQRTCIAEAMGWKMHDHPDCLAKKENWISKLWHTWVLNPKGDLVMYVDIPDYLHDLNAAMKFVEFMRERGFIWIASQCPEESVTFTFIRHDIRHEGKQSTLALAICEAGLRALGLWKVSRRCRTCGASKGLGNELGPADDPVIHPVHAPLVRDLPDVVSG